MYCSGFDCTYVYCNNSSSNWFVALVSDACRDMLSSMVPRTLTEFRKVSPLSFPLFLTTVPPGHDHGNNYHSCRNPV